MLNIDKSASYVDGSGKEEVMFTNYNNAGEPLEVVRLTKLSGGRIKYTTYNMSGREIGSWEDATYISMGD